MNKTTKTTTITRQYVAVDSIAYPRVNVMALRDAEPPLHVLSFLPMAALNDGELEDWAKAHYTLIGTATITLESRPHTELVADAVQAMTTQLHELRANNAKAETELMGKIQNLLAISDDTSVE
jgi:hypothetical protein